MAIGDYVYLLKPESGDTAPHNELNAAQTISGGTISLEDLGSGQYVWRFSGASSSGTIDSYTTNAAATGGGVTVAIKIAVTTNRSADADRVFLYGISTTDTEESLQLRRGTTSSDLYAAWRNSGGTATFGTNFAAGTTMRTIVLRARLGATDYTDMWWSGGGAGPTADDSQSGGGFNSSALDTLLIATASVGTYDIERIAIWHEELADADCDSIRDDIDAALGLGGGGSSSVPAISHSYRQRRAA